jgi:hypothetical protein
MLIEQNYLCAICGNPETRMFKGKITKLAIDHCHKTGEVRGLLCHKCNSILGYANDSIELLANAIKYLSKDKEIENTSTNLRIA